MRCILACMLICLVGGLTPAVYASEASGGATYTPNSRLDAGTGTPRALYFLSDGPYRGTPKDIALQFLRKRIKSLRLSKTLNDVEAVNVQESPMGQHVTFRQTYAGIPVYRSDIVVTIDRSDKVVFAVNNYKSNLRLSRTSPRITGEQALRIANRHLKVTGRLLGDPTSVLMIYAEERVPRLTYRVTVPAENPMGDWEVFVDALSGDVISVQNMMQNSDAGSGRAAAGILTSGTGFVYDPDPLTSAQVPAGTPGYVNNNDADTPQLDSQRVLVTLNDITLSGGVYSLAGPYVQIADFESPIDTFPTPASPDSFRFHRSQKGFEAVMVYYHLDKNQRYIQSLGFTGIQNRSIPADPHGLNGADNSHYIPSVDKIAFGDGGVNDAEDATVILHEYGHAIQNSEKPGWSSSGGEARQIGEGFGDYWAGSYLRRNFGYNTDSVFNWDGTAPTSARRTLTDPRGYPQNGVATMEEHDAGQIWSAVLMILRGDLGTDAMDQLVLQSHYLLGANPTMHDNACAIIQADRSLYGGAHINTLVQRFIARGFLRVDIEFVIDDTGSMSEEIDGVRQALTDFLQNFQQDTCIVYQLTTFKDDVTPRDLTIDLTSIRNEVAGLFASGGGDCPEGSVEALNSVMDTVRRGGTILFVTDASPHPGADIDATIAGLRARGIRVNVLLSGDCYSTPEAEAGHRPFASDNEPGFRTMTKGSASGRIDRSRFTRATLVSDTLVLGDDDFAEVPLPFAFPFCGKSYTSAFVGSNGYVTFGSGSTERDASSYYILNGPRLIGGLVNDLYPPGGGSIVAHQVGSDFDVAFTDIPTYGYGDTVSFTIRLHPAGDFQVTYTRMRPTVAGLAGFTAGNGVGDPGTVDLSAAVQPIQATGHGTAYEVFDGTNNDLQGLTLQYAACTYRAPAGTIGGVVWNDMNKNGIRDNGEPPIPGFQLYISGTSYRGATSDSTGRYLFDDLPKGSYTLYISPPFNWSTVYPPSQSYDVVVDSGTIDTTRDFGELLGSSVAGTVYYDANNNGILDSGEPGLQGWQVTLKGSGPDSIVTTSNGSGAYGFTTLPTGTYTISEELPATPGWTQTAPPGNTWTVNFDSGGSSLFGKNFGNYASPVSVSGTVFYDLNHNGVRDSNDYGLSGWMVFLSNSTTSQYAISDLAGHYSFPGLPPGSYTVYLSGELGYEQTSPGAGSWSLNLNPGDAEAGADFGAYKLQTSFEAFSKLAYETGGFFAYIPATLLGDSSSAQRFVNTAYNVLQGGITKSIGVIEPSQVPLGTTVTVDITGSNTDFQEGMTVSVSGTGVTVSNVKVISPIRLEADLTVDENAGLGFRDIVTSVDLGDGELDTAVGRGSLQLIPTPNGPTILGIAPNTGPRGDSIVALISAVNTNFAAGSVLSLGSGVSVTSVTALSPTKLRATVAVDSRADIGFRDVSVTTGAEVATESVPGPFFVSNSAPLYAFLASIGPGSAYQGDTLTIHINGVNTNFSSGASEVSFSSSGIGIVRTRVQSPTAIDIDVVIDHFAPPGFRDVFVATGGETAAILNAFNVLVSPTEVVETGRIPVRYALLQSYPNPFNPSTIIQFDLPKASAVTLKVYDILGRETATLLSDASYLPGTYRVRYNSGALASGIYFYSLKAKTSEGEVFEDHKKMMFIK